MRILAVLPEADWIDSGSHIIKYIDESIGRV